MRQVDFVDKKIIDREGIKRKTAQWRALGKTFAFTNGCFDILHQGHIFSLSQAAKEADYLIVGLNSDASTMRLKGDNRPINDQQSRAIMLASLFIVDAVVIFDEDTPLELIKTVNPDVLVKGGDYTIEQVVGAKEVQAAGGKVIINPIMPGFSTTGLIEKIHKL
jgi:D-beta-D-heptose 7-phosphate kinase/D-beta-D-heptose 1-phosphate adenosyltransferase